MAFSVVSLSYYLQVARQCLVSDAKDPSPIEISFLEKVVLVICVVSTVTLGFWPTPIMNVAKAAAASLF
jgi:NADH:ubiquinone oxidoreductase subunit 2 (subunit N)